MVLRHAQPTRRRLSAVSCRLCASSGGPRDHLPNMPRFFRVRAVYHSTLFLPPAQPLAYGSEGQRTQCHWDNKYQFSIKTLLSTLYGPRALFPKIILLHGNQAKTYVFNSEFQGLSNAIFASDVIVWARGFFSRQTCILSHLSHIRALVLFKNEQSIG